MTTTPFTSTMSTASTAASQFEQVQQVLPGVWRWADPAGSDRCGTALAVEGGLVLIDPPVLTTTARQAIESNAGRIGHISHIILTSPRRVALAAPYRQRGVTIWAPAQASGGAAEGIDHPFGFHDTLPGGLVSCQLPRAAVPDGEVALLWPHAGNGLLITGDVLPVVGQTPVYREGEAPPVAAYLDAVQALLAAQPGTLAPSHQAPADRHVAWATAYAASLGSPYHGRRAAPVDGPRYLVRLAMRALNEALSAPVVMRRAHGAGQTGEEFPWIADPFACARCGKPHQPMDETCGGPMIARLCNDCRVLRRRQLPVARLMICAGGCCTREGARAVISAARQAVLARGLAEVVDVVPVSCLGECSLGPFVRLSTAQGKEPDFAKEFREQSITRARRYAADEGEVIDDESELVLSRFAALVQPTEAERLVDGIRQNEHG